MKVGDLVKLEYRFDWIKVGVITSMLSRHRAKIQWNDGETSVINILDEDLRCNGALGLEVISASR